MGSMAEACAECSRTCLSLHRTKHSPYPIVSSFFKVMFGTHFSDLLIMPPKFARTIMAMDTYLEDATGQKWEVNLSNVKGGTLAFTKGWHEFSMDHGIELGDFLVFHYFKGSHFVVQIFGRSGCEKPMIFSGKNYPNKRAKLSTDSVPASSPVTPVDSSCKVSPAKEWPNVCMDPRFSVDVSIPMDDVKMEEKPEIRVNVPRQGNTDKWPRDGVLTDVLVEVEPCLVTSKITSYYSSEDDRRDCLLDLSVFEMPEKQVVDAAVTTSLNETQTSVASLDVMKCHMSNDIVEISDEEDSIELSSDTVSGVYVPLDISSPLKAITLHDNSNFSAPSPSCQLPRAEMRIVKSEPKPSTNAADLVQDSANLSAYNGHKVMRHSTWTTSIAEDKGPRSMIMSPNAINLCNSSTARLHQ